MPCLQTSFKEAFPNGMTSMELGEWDEAERHFAAALHASATQAQTTEAASYLAAVKLVKSQASVQECVQVQIYQMRL